VFLNKLGAAIQRTLAAFPLPILFMVEVLAAQLVPFRAFRTLECSHAKSTLLYEFCEVNNEIAVCENKSAAHTIISLTGIPVPCNYVFVNRSEEKMTTNNVCASRGDMIRTLAIKWIREKRPDVLAVIQNEVDKKYPLERRKRRSKTELPAELDAIQE
jgi:hypothetical protein